MRKLHVATIVVLAGLMAASVAQAQPGGGRGGAGGRGFGGGGGFGQQSLMETELTLINVEKVQSEIEMLDEQVEDVKKMAEEARSNRGGFFIEGRPDDVSAVLTEVGRARAVADYVAGMTDRYAILEHQRIFSPAALT